MNSEFKRNSEINLSISNKHARGQEEAVCRHTYSKSKRPKYFAMPPTAKSN